MSNYFERFAITPDFDLDLDLLENKYLALQQKFHPDNLINCSKEDRDAAELESALINQEYEILRSPLKRASYLLTLKGISIDNDACKIKPDQETLALVLDLSEELFSDKTTKDGIGNIRNFVSSEIKKLLSEVKTFFHQNDFEVAAQKLIRVKYLDKILSDIKNLNSK